MCRSFHFKSKYSLLEDGKPTEALAMALGKAVIRSWEDEVRSHMHFHISVIRKYTQAMTSLREQI